VSPAGDRERLRRLPKTDLHCHLDGSVRPATALALGAKVEDPAQLRVSPTCGSLSEFLKVFEAVYPVLRNSEAVSRIAYELIEDCAAENIRHVEARFAPELQATAEFSSEAVIAAALRGLRRGQKAFGTTSSVIVCLLREHSPAQNRRAFDALRRLFNKDAKACEPAVVGLDLAGDEAAIPMGANAAFYEEARALGIHTTCHAGETGGADLETVFELGVERIGHGAKLAEKPKLMELAARRRVPVEVNLTSNVFTKAVPSLEKHPAPLFYKAGVPITLNTDDRAIMGIDLTHEYEAARTLGFTFGQLADISLGSTDHVFLPRAEREAMKARFAAEIDGLKAAP
jgi:adenosine deaminase